MNQKWDHNENGKWKFCKYYLEMRVRFLKIGDCFHAYKYSHGSTTLTRALIFRVLATVKNSAVNSVSPILPIVELTNLGLPNT